MRPQDDVVVIHRLRVLLNRPGLDARLARGELQSGDAALVSRAAQLCGPGTRNRVANGLERALTHDDGRPGLSAAVPINHRAVAAARPYLAQLVEVLRSPAPVAPQGVARARRLLTDAASPLYPPGEPADLRHAAGQALWELDPALGAPAATSPLHSDGSQVAT
jgi:hypothetical protein